MPADIGGGNVDVGFEREISQEVVRRSGRPFQGIAVPDEVFRTERRTLLVGSTAADLVPNPHRADLFIDRLRDALVVRPARRDLSRQPRGQSDRHPAADRHHRAGNGSPKTIR